MTTVLLLLLKMDIAHTLLTLAAGATALAVVG